jgi:hypothetical protein
MRVIYTFRGDTTKGGNLSTDWPELNPLPLVDRTRIPIGQYKDVNGPDLGLMAGAMPSVYFGEPIPEGFQGAIPRAVKIRPQLGKKWPKGKLKDFQCLLVHPLVSARAMVLIESLDPRVHQFFPVLLVREDNGDVLFDGEQFFLLNVCATAPPDKFFPFLEIERRIHAGVYDEKPSLKAELINCRWQRKLPSGDWLEGYSGTTLRFAFPGSRNRWVVEPTESSSRNLFVVPTYSRRVGNRLIAYAGGGNELFASQVFHDAVKREKLSGAHFEECATLDTL